MLLINPLFSLLLTHSVNKARLERWIGGLYDWSGQKWLWGATGQPMNFLGFGELTEGRLREWHCVYMDPEQSHKWNHKLCTRYTFKNFTEKS
jgi:hypothetical protein